MLKSVTKKAIFLFIPILCLSADAFPTGINSVSLAETDITVKASTPENPDPENPVGPVITYPESMKCGTVPTIYINTENYVPIIDKETKIPASLYIDSSMSEKFENLGTAESPLELTIKGRGNASWLYHKKPYKIKFEKKQAPLGLTKSKHFALLPEVNVRAITSYWGFDLGRALGMMWAPEFQPVELILNGNYEGLYMLIESIKIQEGRVDIYEQPEENVDPETIPGGWLIEIDNYQDDFQIVLNESTDKIIRITHKSPEVLSDAQRGWLTDEFNDIIYRLNNDDIFEPTWTDRIDIHSLAQYFVVSELQGNKDAYTGSFYFHKDSGEDSKWIAGPLWDLDYATYGEEWMFNSREDIQVHLIKQALRYPIFLNEIKKVWEMVTPELMEKQFARLRTISDIVTPVIEKDKIRWPQSNYNASIRLMSALVLPTKYKWIRDNLDSLYPTTTGLDNIDTSTSGNLFVRGNSLYLAKADEVRDFGVYDISGRKLPLELGEEIYLGSLPQGIYIVSVTYRDGETAQLKYFNQ